jgi:hypothetical protein
VPCSLDCYGKSTLVLGACACLASRLHACSFGDVAANFRHIFVVYLRHVIHAKSANSASSEKPGLSTPSGVSCIPCTSWPEPTNHWFVLLLYLFARNILILMPSRRASLPLLEGARLAALPSRIDQWAADQGTGHDPR